MVEQRPASMADAYRELRRINEDEEAERLERMTPDVKKHPMYLEVQGKLDAVIDMVKRGADVHDIKDFLDPTPPFVLPTKPGSGIRAKYGTSKHSEFIELRLFSDGRWRDEDGDDFWPDDVKYDWREHEIIEEG